MLRYLSLLISSYSALLTYCFGIQPPPSTPSPSSSKRSTKPNGRKELTPPANQPPVGASPSTTSEATTLTREELQIKADAADRQALRLREYYEYLDPKHNAWATKCPSTWQDEICGLFSNLSEWAFNYAHPETEALDSLSENRKKELVKRLEGYCLRIDLDEIISSLPPEMRTSFVSELVTMFLVKDCVLRFFTNPFCYIVPDPSTDTGSPEGIDARMTDFGKQLFIFHQNILQSGSALPLATSRTDSFV